MRISSGGGVVRLKSNDVKLNRAERKAIWTGANNISETHRATGSLMKRANENAIPTHNARRTKAYSVSLPV